MRKKNLLIIVMLFLSLFLVNTYEYDFDSDSTARSKNINDFNDVDDTSISSLAGEKTSWIDLGIHSPVDTYNPAIKFQTRFVLNDMFNLGLVGSFYNEAMFSEVFDDESGDDYKSQDWDAIKNSLDVYLGCRVNSNVYLGFMLGGGSNYDEYYQYIDRVNDTQTTEKINGYGFVKTGFGLKLNSYFFDSNLEYLFIDQFFDVYLNGKGSVGVENFSFGTSLSRWSTSDDHPVLESVYYDTNTNPSVSYSWNDSISTDFDYYGFASYGKIGIAIPFSVLIEPFSMFRYFSFNIELSHKLVTRFYLNYNDYETSSTLDEYTIRNHLEPSGMALLLGAVFQPIKEIEFTVNYRPNFIISGTDWYDEDGVEYKDYLFMVVHEVEASGLIRFPKVVLLNLGVKYYITQKIEYQYQSDGNYVKETTGGGALTHEISHVLKPILALGFKIIDKAGAQTKLTFTWDPKVILYDGNLYKEATTEEILDTNIMNLANWQVNFEIKFNPKKLAKGNGEE